MSVDSVASLVTELHQYRLLEPEQLAQLPTWQGRFAEPKALARELLQRGWLTAYQANQLLQGRGHDLVLGPYLLLERLGEGGMGAVFKARHQSLGRLVAIKVIRKERLTSANAARRFQREIQAAAQLSHPNIVRALDADEVAGTHFLAMEYVEGGNDLGKLVKLQGPLPIVRACDYVRQAALGLQHACEHGMVHRDIKPANLLLMTRPPSPQPLSPEYRGEGGAKESPSPLYSGERGWGEGVVKILDFGLARVSHGEDEPEGNTTITREGAILGTPDYLAPEQAQESHTVDIRADLYSLGCTLYFLLTGRPPFAGNTLAQKVAGHLYGEPVPVEQLRPDVPPGLGTVLRKLMAKRPEDRYQTPAELAEVLAAAVQHGVWPHPVALVVAGTSGAVAAGQGGFPVAVVAGLAAGGGGSDGESVTSVGWSSIVTSPALAQGSDASRRQLPAPGKPRWRRWAAAGGALLLAGLIGGWLFFGGRGQPEPERKDGDPPAGKGELVVECLHPAVRVLAKGAEGQRTTIDRQSKWRASVTPGTYALELDAEGPAGLELSRKLVTLKPGGTATARVEKAPLSPLALVTRPSPVKGARSWTLVTRTGRGPVRKLAFSPNGKWLAAASHDCIIRLVDVKRPGYSLGRALVGHTSHILALVWSPDSKVLASYAGGKVVWLWHANSGRVLRRLAVESAFFAWSPDSKVLACVVGRAIQLWQADTGRQLRTLGGHSNVIGALSWAPNNAALTVACKDSSVHFWDVENGERLRSLPKQPGTVKCQAFSADGKLLALGKWDGTVRFLNVETKQLLPIGLPKNTHLGWLSWAPDGKSLVSAGGSGYGALRVWDVASGRQRFILNGHPRLIASVSWAPDSKTLASGGTEGAVQFWDARTGLRLASLAGHLDVVTGLAWAHNGKMLATVSQDLWVRRWHSATGRTLDWYYRPSYCTGVAWSPDDRFLASACGAEPLMFWDSRTKKQMISKKHSSWAGALAWSPDGQTVASSHVDKKIRLWDPATGNLVDTLVGPTNYCVQLAWSPDGKFLASGGRDRTVRLWNSVSGRLLHTFTHQGSVFAVAWSLDSKILASGGEDQMIRLWDAATGKRLFVLEGHAGAIRALHWLPDRTTLASLGADSTIRFWEAAAGRQVGAPVYSPAPSGTFAPDGSLLATGGAAYSLRVWESQTGRPQGTVIVLRQGALVIDPDGNYRWYGTGKVEDELLYVVQTAEGQQTLTPQEFAGTYHWKNNPKDALLSWTAEK